MIMNLLRKFVNVLMKISEKRAEHFKHNNVRYWY